MCMPRTARRTSTARLGRHLLRLCERELAERLTTSPLRTTCNRQAWQEIDHAKALEQIRRLAVGTRPRAPGRRRLTPPGDGGDADRHPPRDHRQAQTDAVIDQSVRIDDRDRPRDPAQRQELEFRGDAPALDCCRDARRRKPLSQSRGLPRTRPARRPRRNRPHQTPPPTPHPPSMCDAPPIWRSGCQAGSVHGSFLARGWSWGRKVVVAAGGAVRASAGFATFGQPHIRGLATPRPCFRRTSAV